MATITICSDFELKKIKSDSFHCFPIYFPCAVHLRWGFSLPLTVWPVSYWARRCCLVVSSTIPARPQDLGSSSFSILSFCLFILFTGLSRQEYWSRLPFPSPVDHVLSELSTMTHLSWVALHGMAHSFIEFNKAVVHVIILVSFLWLWFSVCLPSDE